MRHRRNIVTNMCSRKAKFSEKVAISKAKKYGMSYYSCPICGRYHLTKIENDNAKA